MGNADDRSWFTQSCANELQGDLHSARMGLSATLCRGLNQYMGRGLETGDVTTVREFLDILDRIYALENALSPNWRTEGR
jgi:hypothetical protein